MRKIIYLVLVIGVIFFTVQPLNAANVCKIKCRTNEGAICLERGPCEPINEFLLRAARHCREGGAVRYSPITKLLFVDILFQALRLDNELPQGIADIEDDKRYIIETTLLNDKGIDMFMNTNPSDPITRDELARVLQIVTIEEELGYSSGLAEQSFELTSSELVLYNAEVYVDEGKGFELWERNRNLEGSLSTDKHYAIKLDSCNNARVVFGDNKKGKVPLVGSRLKASYKIYGKEDEVVTECETVMLLSNSAIINQLKLAYNPSKPLTKENFADLLVRTMNLEDQLPSDFALLEPEEKFLVEAELLSRQGINIFVGSDRKDLLTGEELARVLYENPVEEVIGVSDGMKNQRFELANAGFVIYDLHLYVQEDTAFEEWNRKKNFIESASLDKDYVVKLDSGNYASIYFGDGSTGKIPELDSPVKVSYRLYAPLKMFTEDDIICVLGKQKPVAETYIPPSRPPDFPPPTDGFDEPATHI